MPSAMQAKPWTRRQRKTEAAEARSRSFPVVVVFCTGLKIGRPPGVARWRSSHGRIVEAAKRGIEASESGPTTTHYCRFTFLNVRLPRNSPFPTPAHHC